MASSVSSTSGGVMHQVAAFHVKCPKKLQTTPQAINAPKMSLYAVLPIFQEPTHPWAVRSNAVQQRILCISAIFQSPLGVSLQEIRTCMNQTHNMQSYLPQV
eukprot:15170318-Ditylum_brightwellii.AAC.1